METVLWNELLVLDVDVRNALTKTITEEAENEIKQMFIESKDRAYFNGGMAIIKTLRGAMAVSGLDYVPKQWIDTAAKELNNET